MTGLGVGVGVAFGALVAGAAATKLAPRRTAEKNWEIRTILRDEF